MAFEELNHHPTCVYGLLPTKILALGRQPINSVEFGARLEANLQGLSWQGPQTPHPKPQKNIALCRRRWQFVDFGARSEAFLNGENLRDWHHPDTTFMLDIMNTYLNMHRQHKVCHKHYPEKLINYCY